MFKKNKLYMSVYIFKPKDGILYAYFFNQKYCIVLYAVASALTGTRRGEFQRFRIFIMRTVH